MGEKKTVEWCENSFLFSQTLRFKMPGLVCVLGETHDWGKATGALCHPRPRGGSSVHLQELSPAACSLPRTARLA